MEESGWGRQLDKLQRIQADISKVQTTIRPAPGHPGISTVNKQSLIKKQKRMALNKATKMVQLVRSYKYSDKGCKIVDLMISECGDELARLRNLLGPLIK